MIHSFTHKKYASVLISKKNEKQVNQWSKVIELMFDLNLTFTNEIYDEDQAKVLWIKNTVKSCV